MWLLSQLLSQKRISLEPDDPTTALPCTNTPACLTDTELHPCKAGQSCLAPTSSALTPQTVLPGSGSNVAPCSWLVGRSRDKIAGLGMSSGGTNAAESAAKSSKPSCSRTVGLARLRRLRRRCLLICGAGIPVSALLFAITAATCSVGYDQQPDRPSVARLCFTSWRLETKRKGLGAHRRVWTSVSFLGQSWPLCFRCR